jgi:PTH1 family peptidyl-tRNA hydrolase
MVNTLTRAHVGGPVPSIPASAGDPDLEKYPPSDDRPLGRAIEAREPLSRKEKRRKNKQDCQRDASTSLETEKPIIEPTTAQSDDDKNSTRLSRRERKRLRKQQIEGEFDSDTPLESAPGRKPSNKVPKARKPKPTPLAETQALRPSSITPSLSSYSTTMPPTGRALLVCSIGNPGTQYANTLHSAGHTIVNIIRERGMYHPFTKGMEGLVATPDTTRFRLSLTGFTKDGSRGLLPSEDDFTLWQSTKLMNQSGVSVSKAWKMFTAQQMNKHGLRGRLVVIHDELEAPLGRVKIIDGIASARGHNGVKSVQDKMGRTQFWRIGVGIGRPVSRDPVAVSKYVLRKMTYTEEKAIDNAASDVLAALREIAEGGA